MAVLNRDVFQQGFGDEQPITIVRTDISGGGNTRQDPVLIKENQVMLIYNADISIAGQSTKRRGITLIENLGTDAGTGLFGYEPDGGTNLLVATHGQKLETWTGTGSFAERKTNFTNNLQTTIIKAGESGEGEVFLVGNGTDNWFRFEPDDLGTPEDLGNTSGTGSDSPPKSTVALYYRNRVWVLKDAPSGLGNLFFSSAYPATYSTAFDTVADAFRIPCGTERALVGLRDQGIIIVGSDQIWGLNPSVTPAPTTDKPEKLLSIGAVANNTVCTVSDDVLFLATDGVRGVFRTQQDKLQMGQSFPLSFSLKDEFDTISWAYISKACAVYFDNKYMLALPVSEATYNNSVWVYYPATNAWVVYTGWNVGAWAKLKIDGEERLYCIDSANGKVYRALFGYSDNTTAINYQEEGREENCGFPFNKKSGGELIIKAIGVGDYDVSVYVSVDSQDYQLLGTINLSGNAPTLAVSLPFTLVNPNIVEKKFHLDSLGPWVTLQIKLQHNATNGSDDITMLERNIVTYKLEYENE
jgi:hypothetical protein